MLTDWLTTRASTWTGLLELSNIEYPNKVSAIGNIKNESKNKIRDSKEEKRHSERKRGRKKQGWR